MTDEKVDKHILEAVLRVKNRVSKVPELYDSDELISIYTAFRDQVHNPQSVLYPSCAFDASPAKVFDNVTFVDVEHGSEGCVDKLLNAGHTAHKQDIKEYTPKDLHDLLILLNPAIPTEWASRHVKSGGYIISNDYHGNASELFDTSDEFILWGVIDFVEKDRRKKDNRVEISRDLENLFQPVANGEELKRYRPTQYEFTKSMFESMAMNSPAFNADGSFDEVWAEYRERLQSGMPSKRVAERYIFVKK